MCKREMTLGEEIIGLSTRGIDTPTVERMYRKYLEMLNYSQVSRHKKV